MFVAMTLPNIGFAITFANGYEMSVQWGKMNYCHKMGNPTDDPSCQSAEIAIFGARFGGENVTKKIIPQFLDGAGHYITYVTPEHFAKITAIVEGIKR